MTISDYTIYCTEEQTKKALKLGAPISEAMSRYNARLAYERIQNGKETREDYNKQGIAILGKRAYDIPTAEQMMVWLRTKGFAFGIDEHNDGYDDHVFWRVKNNQDKTWYISDDTCKEFKDAVLAAIDAALKYLSVNK